MAEARTVTLSMIRHVQYLALSHAGVDLQSVGQVELLRADWSPMHLERLRFPFSNKKSSNSSVGGEKCWEIDEIDEGDDVQCTCKRS